MSGPACPSCGAPLPARNPGVVASACAYCDTIVTWDADAARDSGRKSRLPQGFTRLYTGATGTLRDRAFTVLGRVRYSYGRGFWDEWAISIDGTDALTWITEDDHELAAEVGKARIEVGTPKDLKVGATVRVDGHEYLIEEVGQAECVGIEGQLPSDILPGEVYRYADGSTRDGVRTIGIEWDDDVPMVFTGRWVAHGDLRLDDEGVEW